MHVAYRSQNLISVEPEEVPIKQKQVKRKPEKEKSIYILRMEKNLRKAALKKYEARLKEIHKYFPDWQPKFKS